MNVLRVAPIVEGHGEDQSIRILLQRVWRDLLGGEHIEVIRPIRRPRSKLIKSDELQKAVELAALKLFAMPGPPACTLILLLLDAEPDAPCVLGPRLLADAIAARSDVDISCVLAHLEYETWFVGAAESLAEFLDVGPAPPPNPEEVRVGKAWIQRHFRGVRYSETVDQPRMTAGMDLHLCRQRCPSFDKLCRDLEKRLPTA